MKTKITANHKYADFCQVLVEVESDKPASFGDAATAAKALTDAMIARYGGEQKPQTEQRPKEEAPCSEEGYITFSGKLTEDPKVEEKEGNKGPYQKVSLKVKGNDGITYLPSFLEDCNGPIGSCLKSGDAVKIAGDLKPNKKGKYTYNNIWNAKMIDPNPNTLGGAPAPRDTEEGDDIPF